MSTTVDGIRFINNPVSDFVTYTSTTGNSPPSFCPTQPSQINSDWRIGIKYGFNTNTLTCLKLTTAPRPLYCPEINKYSPGNKNNVFWTTNLDYDAAYPNPPGRQVTCKYPTEIFNTPNDVKLWKDTYLSPNLPENVLQQNQKTYDNILMPKVCMQRADSKDCVPDNGITLVPGACTGSTGLFGCSRVTAELGGWAGECKAWAARNKPVFDQEIITYCANPANKCTVDCRCENRAEVDEIYNKYANVKSGADGCWYRPCKSLNGKYLVRDIFAQQQQTCETALCEVIVNIWATDTANVDFNIGNQTIDCGRQLPAKSGGGGGGNDPINQIDSVWDKYSVYILIGIAIFAIIVVILIITNISKTPEVEDPVSSDNSIAPSVSNPVVL